MKQADDMYLLNMEEGNGASEHKQDNATSAFYVQQRILGGKPLYLNIPKEPGFQAILVQTLGPSQVSSMVVDTLFEEIDKRHNGYISAEDIANYLCCVEQFGAGHCLHFVVKRLLRASTGGALFFVSASSIAITNNVMKRRINRPVIFGLLAPPLITWFLTIGSIFFIWSMMMMFSNNQVFKQMMGSESEAFGRKVVVFARKNLTSLGQV